MLEKRSLKIALAVLTALFAIYSAAGFFILPPIVRKMLTERLEAALGRQAAIQSVSINPYTISATVTGLAIKGKDRKRDFASIGEIHINLQLKSLLGNGIVIKELKVKRPYLNVVRQSAQTYNFSDIITRLRERPKASKKKPFLFSVNNIRVTEGLIDFLDKPENKANRITDINISIPFISNRPYFINTFVKPRFQAKVNGSPVLFEGETKPFSGSLESVINIKTSGVDLPYYLAYLPIKTHSSLLSGKASSDLNISYIQYRTRPPTLILTGVLELRDIRIAGPDGKEAVSLPDTSIDIGFAEFFSRKVHLFNMVLKSPSIRVLRDWSGKINLLALLPERKTPSPPEKPKPPFSIDVDSMQVQGGKAVLEDRMKKQPFRAKIEPINLKVERFSTDEGKQADYEFSASSDSISIMKASGAFSINPLGSDGIFEMDKMILGSFRPYYSGNVLFEIRNGDLSVSGRYHYAKKPGTEKEMGISDLDAAVDSLVLSKKGRDFLKIPSIAVKDLSANFAKKDISVRELATKGGQLSVRRLKSGKIDILPLFPPGPKTTKVRKKPWLIKLARLKWQGYAVHAEDLMPEKPVKLAITGMDIEGANLSTVKGSKGRVSFLCEIGKKGRLAATGTAGLNPVSAKLKTELKDLDIAPIQPYTAKKIDIIIVSGFLDAKGNVSARYSKPGGLTALFTGGIGVKTFLSRDPVKKENFLRWNTFGASGVAAGHNPDYIYIKGLALSGFLSRVIVNPDGTVNLFQILKKGKAAQAAPAKKMPANREVKPPPLLQIDNITLEHGEVDFTDHHIKPNYSATITDITGRIEGVASNKAQPSGVDLFAQFGGYAPIEITGKVNPFRKYLFMDLNISFRNMDMSPLSPYAGRYIGYQIEQGQLVLSLKYQIAQSKLEASNKITLNNLKLGKEVPSPLATKLPVKFAISLLKDRNGNIHLDIPVSGDLRKPEFSITDVIFKAVSKFFTRIVTEPFRLVASLFGHGEEQERLGYAEFDYGSPALTETDLKTLDVIEKTLYERPGLKLSLMGHVDIGRDRAALREQEFQTKLKRQKVSDMLKRGKPASVQIEQVTIAPDEYDKYLWEAYKHETFPRPRDIFGFIKKLPPAEMRNLILTHISITSGDLLKLAFKRAKAVKDYVLKPGRVKAGRVFIAEPSPLQPTAIKNVKLSRVDLTLE
ncbi:MAG: DUF748 domain-containing protein [Nitrospiraceae bacterium]|nr:DUF748 domain-containing protein [Nitrospiraceae bacterium]